MVGTDAASSRKQVAGGTDVDITLLVECEVGAREGTVVPLALVPDRDLRRDASADQPSEELACTVCRISSETFGLESKSSVCPLDHGLRCSDFVVGSGRGG